tara:strand:+ start:212 stop:655 length:444 start_codon:yes stop_codon:yes gene_type:complete
MMKVVFYYLSLLTSAMSTAETIAFEQFPDNYHTPVQVCFVLKGTTLEQRFPLDESPCNSSMSAGDYNRKHTRLLDTNWTAFAEKNISPINNSYPVYRFTDFTSTCVFFSEGVEKEIKRNLNKLDVNSSFQKVGCVMHQEVTIEPGLP